MSTRTTGRQILLVLLPTIGFYAYMAWIGAADWGRAGERAIALVLAAVVAWILIAWRRSMPMTSSSIALGILGAILGLLILYRGFELVRAIQTAESAVATSDIARTTIESVSLISKGKNPYTAEMDPLGAEAARTAKERRFFGGFKYGPVTSIIFAPGVLAAGKDGYLATNLLLLLVAGAGAGWWVLRQSGAAAALGAAALMLAPSFLGHEMFSSGVNDMAAVALGLFAFVARARLPLLSGLLLGLSFATKPLPAALYALPMLFAGESKLRFSTTSAATAALLYLPWLIVSPRELFSNLVLFNLVRSPDSTSVLATVGMTIRSIARILSLTAAVALPVLLRKRLREEDARTVAAVCAVSVTVFLLGGGHIHRNYLLWLLPLLAASIAASFWSTRGATDIRPAEVL